MTKRNRASGSETRGIFQDNIPSLQQITGVLADTFRLKLVGLLATQEYSLEELSLLLHTRISLVSRHLNKLQQLEIVITSESHKQRYKLNLKSLQDFQRSLLASEKNIVSPLEETALEDEERRVLKGFFVGSRLTTIPAGRDNLAILVQWFARRFVVDRRYQEAEVNEIIGQYYHDAAFFRKDMVGRGFMRRENGVYWRVR